MSFKPTTIILATVFFLLASAFDVSAQGTTSRVTGTVTDSTGAAVEGATVTLTSEATATSLTTETSDSGAYIFDLIQIGEYTVTVEKSGFKKFVSTKNTVNINLPATVNVALEPGGVTEVVTVESTVEQVQTGTSGNVGSTITERETESLPIVGARGRNPLDILLYQPGVVSGANTGGGVHVNGSRDRAFNFTLDGIDINESSAGGSNFTPLRPNPDSIQEFQIVTSNATAELGRSSGAQVTLITRSGTNRFTGNLFEYYQTPDFHANEFELNLLNIGRRQFVQHIFGGTVSGPLFNPGFGEGTPMLDLFKDRAFFFVNLQFLRASETRLAQRTVYTAAARQGFFRYLVGGRNLPSGTPVTTANPLGAAVNADGSPRYPNCSATVTTACIQTYNVNNNLPASVGTVDPFITSLLGSLPTPNDFSVGDGLNFARFNFVAPQIEKQYDFVTRFDFKVNDNNQFYVRYAEGEQNTFGDIVNAGLQPFPGFPNLVNTFRDPKNLAINYRSSPSAKFTNEFVFGINLFGFSFNNEEPNPQIPFILNTVTDPGTNFAYNARRVRTYQFVDNLSFDFSPHTIKTGLNFRFGKQFDDRSSAGGAIEPSIGFGAGASNFTGYNLPTTGINTNDLTNLRSTINNLIGRIGSISQGFVIDPNDPSRFAPAGTRYNFTAYYPEYDFYVQDTWRVRQNLTLDLGLRWEFKLQPSSRDLPIVRPNQPFTAGAPPTNTLRFEEGDIFKNDFNNYSPSVGFAWDPFKNGKTAVRANYRLAYDRFPSQVFANFIYQSAPGNTTTSTITGVSSLNLLIRNGIPDLTPALTPDALRQTAAFSTNAINLVDPDLVFPENHQWFAGVQREIWGKNVLEVNYIGRRGVHLFGAYDSNQVNINARDPRCPESFLQAFNALRASTTANSCLINLLFTGNTTNNAGTATFRGIPAITTTLAQGETGGSVATAAAVVSQRACQTADVTAGLCTSTNQQLIGRTLGNPFFIQPFPQFTGALNVLDSNDYSRYNGLEVIVKRRLNQGVSYQVGYTYSVSKDTRSFDPTFATAVRGAAQSSSSTPFDLNNRSLNYAFSDFDRRHTLKATYLIELPFGRGRRFGSDMPKVLDFIVGGWQLAGLFNLASGRPFTIYSGLNTVSNAVSSFANCNGCTRGMGKLIQEGSPGATTGFFLSAEQRELFSAPGPGEIGNTTRNFFIGPRQFQTDASLSKKFKFTERLSFDLRVDARNLTNTPSFGIPIAVIDPNNSAFGRIQDLVVSFSRRIQFSGKFNF